MAGNARLMIRSGLSDGGQVSPWRCAHAISALFGIILASALEVQQKPVAPAAGTARISGVVVAADSGLPLPGVMVTIRGGTIATQAAMTDADGRYRAEGLPAGRYVLTFNKAGFLTLEYGQRTAFSPRTEPGATEEDVRIEVAPPATRLSGRVEDGCAAGAECDVLIFSRDDLKWTLPRSRYVRRTRTVEGRFEIAGLPEGSYVAVALPAIDRNRERDPAFLRHLAASPLAVPVTLGAGRPEAVDLRVVR
jgi:hypothetical protein